MKDSLNPLLRDAGPGDFDAILALNAASVQALSPLDHARLEWLHGMRAAHRVVSVNGDVRAFLLAFREGSAYDSPNYRWFAARYPRFLYVDRVVVDAETRGHGLGRLLYEDLITLARSSEVGMICCEYDTEPPNPASAGFHARFGFREVGAERLGPGKAVSLRVLEL